MNEQTSFGLITTIEVPTALSAKGSCWTKEGLLLANYVYDEDKANYLLNYTIVGNNGELKDIEEDKGVLPTLFLSPNQVNFVSLVTLDDEEQTLSFPILDKEQRLFKGSKSFNGRFVGTTEESSIFYDVDIWDDNKADVMFVLRFEEDSLIEEQKIAIPFPKGNKISISAGHINLITEVEDGWLHREIDEEGVELRSRILDFEFPFVHEALSLSFDSKSYLLCEENGVIGIVEIEVNGECSYGELLTIGDEFFGTWHPQVINENTTATQFTTEFGNGWLVIRNDELVEIFYNKNKRGYKNLLNEEILSIDNNDLVVSGISVVGGQKDTFGVVFYPRKPRKEMYNKVFVLQRSVN
ncbi:hypothetical protein [Myroides pelagicus]|uniref:Uncharacterized protein n=1 Tax=Myroides pelagicus TaxID=270914 RepID=A0A7K1GNH1_9FLAO|nr:hypothetical protein [Myroides pelagicus]MEC4113868.1 hypothetical protein [Myroides pelagicus]MTH30425.1 hypothetical protein [Myroides pelagicus]